MPNVSIHMEVQEWSVLDRRPIMPGWHLFCESGATTAVLALDSDTLRNLHDEIEQGAEWLAQRPPSVEQWEPQEALPVNGPWGLTLTYHPKHFGVQCPHACLAEGKLGAAQEAFPYWEIEASEGQDATVTLQMSHRDIGALLNHLRRLLLRENASLLTAPETLEEVRAYAMSRDDVDANGAYALLDQVATARRSGDASFDPVGALLHGGMLPITSATRLRMDDFRGTELERKLASITEEVEGWGVQKPTPLTLGILRNLAITRGAMPIIDLGVLRADLPQVLRLLADFDVADPHNLFAHVPAEDLADRPDWLLELVETGLANLLLIDLIALTDQADEFTLRQRNSESYATWSQHHDNSGSISGNLVPVFGPTEAALFWRDRARASERPTNELQPYIDRPDCGGFVREILAARGDL